MRRRVLALVMMDVCWVRLENSGVLSFNGNKMITTSGGGALYLVRTGRLSRRSCSTLRRAREAYPYYQHERIGYNYPDVEYLCGYRAWSDDGG